jgi:hypothetical protein
MRLLTALFGKLKSLLNAVFRFPIIIIFLCVIALLNAISIEHSSSDFFKIELSLTMGCFVYAVFQVCFEKCLSKFYYRIIFMAFSVAISTGYYFLIAPYKTIGIEIRLRTIIATFALLILFILIPSIKSKTSFNNTFMIFFKSIFTSVFFSAIIWGGISLIIFAVDSLLFKVNSNIYIHVINIIWVVFAPIFFLSLFPCFVQSDENELKIERASVPPKFLSVLISYILVPLSGIYSVVLIIYIIQRVGTSFWTNNLLEPLILSYAITIIVLYILASDIRNKFAIFYRAVMPKVLVPVVLFQLVASIINTVDSGITQPRYFVLIFGVYAVISGVLLNILPVRKNGIIAIVIVIFSIISITPPVDVFTISRVSQISILEGTLSQDNMLVNNKLIAKSSISQADKTKIINSMQSINDMEHLKDLTWLPTNFNLYTDFDSKFGFSNGNSGNPQSNVINTYFQIDNTQPLQISGYDFIQLVNVSIGGDTTNNEIGSFTVSNATYKLFQTQTDKDITIKIEDSSSSTIISYSFKQAFDSLSANNTSTKNTMPVAQMTFTTENNKAKMKFIIQNASITTGTGQNNSNASVEVLFSVK